MMRLRSIGLLLVLFAITSITQARPNHPSNLDAKIRHGDYLTHHVAMCVQCHSPRDEQGNIITTEEFRGAPVPLQSPTWASTWAFSAINIRGLPGWREEEVIHLLQTGQRFNGARPLSPMPPFRMSLEDAQAVVAYLKSLQ